MPPDVTSNPKPGHPPLLVAPSPTRPFFTRQKSPSTADHPVQTRPAISDLLRPKFALLMARPPLPIENGASCQTPPTQVVEWEGSGGWHPRPCPARRRAGHAKPAVNPIACGSNPVLNPASAGVLNPALAGGHPPGQGSLAVLSKNVVLVRADQGAVFRGVGPRGPGGGNRRGASWSVRPLIGAQQAIGQGGRLPRDGSTLLA